MAPYAYQFHYNARCRAADSDNRPTFDKTSRLSRLAFNRNARPNLSYLARVLLERVVADSQSA